MPIWDNDGTASYPVAAIYDHDGTARHQISKVWDNDGTASSLVYTATPEYLYKDGTYNTEYLSGFSNCTDGSTYIQVAASTSVDSGSKNKTVTATSNESIDWSNIDYITINGTWNPHTEQGGATKSSRLMIKIGNQTIPLNTRTAVAAIGHEYLTIEVYVYVHTDQTVAYGVAANVTITQFVTE